ncbi:hypothetical protein D1AOALGA4SA_11182 [Olavius algarvensis Delta 1 endosymbiont]|nr:hypothetical protein D1AOALGA4SA_11182 [Olavius algarvensis Delta 1 endosymbiont]
MQPILRFRGSEVLGSGFEGSRFRGSRISVLCPFGLLTDEKLI